MRILIVAALLLPGICRASVPRPDHIVVVIEENHSYSQIIGNVAAPYINALASQGALFTQSSATTHPSQPNYIALFSGSTQGITDNSCPNTFTTANLGGSLIAASLSFIGYSEDLPEAGSTVCNSGQYWRKHNPWVNFTDVPASSNLPFSSFPADFSQLPTVAMVVPNQDNDMHDGSIAQGDTWLKDHLDAYVQWAQTHNSLLILTFDEDDGTEGNRIVTLFVGPMVAPGQYAEPINHYNVLRTIEDMYGLAPVGESANVAAISDVWKSTGVNDPADSDADGFPNELETALGTNPFDAMSTPFGIDGRIPLVLSIKQLSIRLNFAHGGRDRLRLRAALPIPEGFVPGNQHLVVDAGGVIRNFMLDSRGNARLSDGSLRMPLQQSHGIVSAQLARLRIDLAHNDYAPQLQDEGLTSSDLRNAGREVEVIVLFNGSLYRAVMLQIYSARQGKFGHSR